MFLVIFLGLNIWCFGVLLNEIWGYAISFYFHFTQIPRFFSTGLNYAFHVTCVQTTDFCTAVLLLQVFFVNCSCLCLWHAANTTPYIWTHLKLDWETLWCLENGQLGQPINHWVKNIITKTVLNWGFPPQTQKHVPFLDFSFMQCTLKVLRFMLRFTGINHGVFKHPISCAVYLH